MTGFDLEIAWEAVYKDATMPPINDTTILWVSKSFCCCVVDEIRLA
jgi:hypothetical protein